MEDQAGNSLDMPAEERKSLMVAMALHEKGKSALKKQDYMKALVYFLDADQEFRYYLLECSVYCTRCSVIVSYFENLVFIYLGKLISYIYSVKKTAFSLYYLF